jgi:ubiquinone/menaquinone biosynthesis C-methylase UbiE
MAQQLQERTTEQQQHKGYRGLGMEGRVARWYTKNTGRDLTDYHRDARRIAERAPAGGRVLDLAPGPGYVAIEVARLGQHQVVGLDISETFVQIASERARTAGVEVDFQRGDAAHMPFADDSFDVVFCRAAFKNFSDPVGALREIYRVLKPGGTGLIVDLHKDVPRQTLDRYVTRYVKNTRQSWLDALMTRLTFRFVLIPRAYRMIDFDRMVQAANLPQYEIREEGIGLDVWISK